MPQLTNRDIRRIAVALSAVAGLIAVGAYTVHRLEGWGWVDSFYFTTMTVSTVGHGELYPSTDATKILQSLLALAGVMVVVYSMSVVGSIFFRRAEGSHAAGKFARRIEKGRKGWF